MNPYRLNLEKWAKKGSVYFGFRLTLWFISIYGTIWGIFGTVLYFLCKTNQI